MEELDRLSARGSVVIKEANVDLSLDCHGIVYQFILARFPLDGAIAIKHKLGYEMTYRARDNSEKSANDWVMIYEGTQISSNDNALKGRITLRIEKVEASPEHSVVHYAYTWSPYVCRDRIEDERINVHFSTRARILNQLGEQLIKNEGVALLELIKNAYDADASLCDVVLHSPSDVKNAFIEILDDGCGMSPQTVQNVWLEIGTDNKERLRIDPATRRTAKYSRTRLGEKGIGRLGVHRLGRYIELITKSADSIDEVRLIIDWRKVENASYIEDLPIIFEKRAPKVFTGGNTGTKIFIKDFRDVWTKRMAVEAARTISGLNSPFSSNDSFNVDFRIEGSEAEKDWLVGMPNFLDVKENAMFSFDIIMSGSSMISFKYGFRPLQRMDQSMARNVERTAEDPMCRMMYPSGVYDYWDRVAIDDGSSGTDIDISELGLVRFSGVVFDLNPKILSLGLIDKKAIKQFLSSNCGVRVFRDNMRILDYGEPGNDWLGLNARKLGKASSHISNSVIVASVDLHGESSRVLREKANREGFIESEAYNRFIAALTFCMERIDAEWRHDKDLLKKRYEQQDGAIDVPVKTPIADLKSLVSSAKIDDSLKERIVRGLGRIEDDYSTMTDNLIKSAGAGLNLVMVIHQIEKVISETQAALKQNSDKSLIVNLVNDLESLVSGYSIILRRSELKWQDVSVAVNHSAFNVGFRLRAHKISLEKAYEKRVISKGFYSRGHLVNAIINLFDNAIWWLGYYKIEDAAIYVDISEKMSGYVTIVVADNGYGFSIPKEDLEKPFVTAKPGGMGIGLHLTAEIMRSMGGQLLFPNREEFDVPQKFKGAIVALALKKEVL